MTPATITQLHPTPPIDPDLVAAIAYCRVGGVRPVDDGTFRRAEGLGLLAHDPIWRATTAGEGVLIAAGLLEGARAPRQRVLYALWARSEQYPAPQFVAAWPESIVDVWPEQHDRDIAAAKRDYEDRGEGGPWTYWSTIIEIDVPDVPA